MEIKIDSPHDSLNLGIKVVYQEISLISEFTAAENIYLENFPVNKLGIVNWKKLFKDAENLFNKIGFNLDPKAKVSELSISQQQMVEIARAVFQNASVVIMDEPTAALSQKEIKELDQMEMNNIKK